MRMKAYLGIDGGGTSTRAVIVSDQGLVTGEAASGPANFHNLGMNKSLEHMRQAALQASAQAGLQLEPSTGHPVFDGVWVGCAGIRSEADTHRMTQMLEQNQWAPSGRVSVVNDLYNALAAGLNGEPGIALIAGTGSNCLGLGGTGRSFMCGGWGWLLDAPGSAFGLTHAAMMAATRAADHREPHTRILPELLDFLNIDDANDLPSALYSMEWAPDKLAAFAPVLMRLAREQDAAAKRVLEQGAASLAELVATTAKRLDFHSGVNVVLMGGCARSGEPYQNLLEQAIQLACPQATFIDPLFEPRYGAAINALRCFLHPLPPPSLIIHP